ncbi:MAG: C4-type zinc ribbon domain-containing protein [Geovibrio sp.]|nr:C4-type zinc ribbon domain-containing protein [Geovibrio sp.]
MLPEVEQLIELQKLDNRIAELETKVSQVPGFLKDVRNGFEAVRAECETVKTKHEADTETLAKLTKECAENKALLDKAQSKLPNVKNNKEYEAVLKELDVLKKNVNEGEYKILELQDTVSASQSKFEELQTKETELKASLDEKEAQKQEEDSEANTELAGLKTKREEAQAVVKKSIISKYERVRHARNNLAIVRVNEETCTGCYIKVPPQLYVEVKKGKALHQCPNCQRFLYALNDD